jgi:nicotinate phosphoribosyltransferase
MSWSISALSADLYELTMAAAYFENDLDAPASFELFVSRMPDDRGFLVAAGLDRALDYLENLRFTDEDIAYLRTLPVFAHVGAEFFDKLRQTRFQGTVHAMREGTPVFAGEPLLRVTAPLLESQLVETTLLAIVSFETMIASKAARVVHAARGRSAVEFGTRRAHGPDAGLYAARAAYLAGCGGTSNVLAGARFGIPVVGTMAHSFVMAYVEESESFADFMRVFPDDAVLLLDTYDTMTALERMIAGNLRPRAVRVDSGDLLDLSRRIRARLDEAGMQNVGIFATGDLDEHKIQHLLNENAPIDSFGVGTQLATSADQPALSCVYKLVNLQAGPAPHYRAKLSTDKLTYPSCKQVFRFRKDSGELDHDLVASIEESVPGAEPLLFPVMRNGQRLEPSPTIAQLREECAGKIAQLPPELRQLVPTTRYRVEVSARLKAMLENVRSWSGGPR